MKLEGYAMIAIVTVLSLGCNKEQIGSRTIEVNLATKNETGQPDFTAQITKARIEAQQYWMRVQLDSDKKLADAKSAAETIRTKSEE